MKFKPEDFCFYKRTNESCLHDHNDPYCSGLVHAEFANAKFEEWLNKQPTIYGSLTPTSEGTIWSICRKPASRQKAKLVKIERISEMAKK